MNVNLFTNCVDVCPPELMKLRDDIKKCKICVVPTNGSNSIDLNANLINQFVDQSKEPVTTNYWSDACFNIPADLLILGQDWGSVDMRDRFIANDRNESDNPTRKLLEVGLERIGCKNRAAYLNSVMCLRNGKSTGTTDFKYRYIDNCKIFVDAHIKVLKPKVIVTMGWEVTKRYVDESIKLKGPFRDIANQPIQSQKYNAWILPIYHLGSYGQLNKKKASKEKEDEFGLMKELLEY